MIATKRLFGTQLLRSINNRVHSGILKQQACGLKTWQACGEFESPHPLLFVPGGWEHGEAWEETASHFSEMGYETGVMDWNWQSGSGSIKDVLPQLQESVQSLGPMTIIVSHCVGAYIAQKYLESFSCSGLVLINPFPLDPDNVIRELTGIDSSSALEDGFKKYQYTGRFSSLLSQNDLFDIPPEKLLNLPPTDQRWDRLIQGMSAPSLQIIRDIVSAPINLEHQVVPSLVVSSELDCVTGATAPESVIHLHRPQQHVTLKGASHLFMLHQTKCTREFQEALEKWLEETY